MKYVFFISGLICISLSALAQERPAFANSEFQFGLFCGAPTTLSDQQKAVLGQPGNSERRESFQSFLSNPMAYFVEPYEFLQGQVDELTQIQENLQSQIIEGMANSSDEDRAKVSEQVNRLIAVAKEAGEELSEEEATQRLINASVEIIMRQGNPDPSRPSTPLEAQSALGGHINGAVISNCSLVEEFGNLLEAQGCTTNEGNTFEVSAAIAFCQNVGPELTALSTAFAQAEDRQNAANAQIQAIQSQADRDIGQILLGPSDGLLNKVTNDIKSHIESTGISTGVSTEFD